MKLTAHPLPAPRSLLLEAEQLLAERFLFHCRILNIFCLEMPTFLTPLSHGDYSICSAMQCKY